MQNWAGNIAFRARHHHRPSSVEELRVLVAGGGPIRAVGTGHSFSPVADTTGALVSLAGLPPVIAVDQQRATVTVPAGMRYGELATHLHAAGRAVANLASLPHLSVAGAVATGTHGSGSANGGLATAVQAIELVTGDGELLRLSRDGDPGRFPGAVVALGALGIVTSLTLATVESFEVAQYVYEGVPLDAADEVLDGGYSVSLFTDWQTPTAGQVWVKHRTADGPHRPPVGGRPATRPMHPVAGMPAVNCTEQLGVPGPWYERLAHFRLGFTPSSGEELQSEYLLPRTRTGDAVAAVAALGPLLRDALQISEIRAVAGDDLWLSPAYGCDSVAVHFTWVRDEAAVLPVVAEVEAALAPLGARPHWGKVFTLDPETVRARYERAADFGRLRWELDPAGRFGNELVDRYLPAA